MANNKVMRVKIEESVQLIDELLTQKYQSGLKGLKDRTNNFIEIMKDVMQLTLELKQKVSYISSEQLQIQLPKSNDGVIIIDSILYTLNLIITDYSENPI